MDHQWFLGLGLLSSSKFGWADLYMQACPDVAPVVTNNALKKFIPVIAFGCGVRFKHLEMGLNNQVSLSSPVKDFTYNGYTHTVPLIWKSIGYSFDGY